MCLFDKFLKEKCVAKSTEEKGYDYQDFNCDTKWYGYMSQDTLDICTSQLGLIKAAGGTDGEGWGKYSYDVCSFQPGTYAKTYYGIGAVAQSEKMVKQARDAEQQVTDDKAKNAEDKEDVNEAKKGRLHVYECSDAVEKKEAKDIYFCFVKHAGDRFFGDIESDWEGKHMVTIEKLDGTKSTLEEIEIEVWDKCGDVTDSCGRTTSKDVEYFTKNEKYVLLKKGAEKKDDDSKGDDVKSKKTLTYEDLEEFKYDLAVKDIIAECTTKPNDPVCQIVLHKDFEGALQDIRKEVANEAAKKIAEEANEAAKKREEEEIERLQRKADYYKEKIEEHQEEQELKKYEEQLEALEENEQKLIIEEENKQELIESQRLINLEKYGARMNNGAPVVETSSE